MAQESPETKPAAEPSRQAGGLVGLIMSLAGGGERGSVAADPAAGAEAAKPAAAEAAPVTADAFRGLVAEAEEKREDKSAAAARAAELERHRQVKAMLQQHLDDEMWQTLLAHARAAAASGQTEFQLLRFPSAVCSDGGRKIDVNESDWGTTLRGEAADLYQRWERKLKPAGFHISARILSWPQGMRGDIGLFLIWP